MIYNRFFSLVFLLSFFTNITLSQEPARCGTDEIHEFYTNTDTEYKRSYSEVLKALDKTPQTPSFRAVSNEVLTIPIVVHIMHDGDVIGEGGNITDEVIYDAIAALNNDFEGNPLFPANNAGAPFYNDPQDVDVEFCFATVDPDGNPTNGITRTNVSATYPSFAETGMVTTSLLDDCSEFNVKSLSAWDNTEYCNIWILYKLNGGASPLGFAYLPPFDNIRDGIVVHHRVFGYGEDYLIGNFNQNKTITHEMGHYLGLRHTFNNTSSCGPETNCAAQGDALCDTPPTTGSVGCNPISCYETMTENFMDYSNDDCMDRFSPDGVTRMRDKLLQWRSDLLDNGNCTPLDGISVGTSTLTVPSQGACTELIDNISVTLNSNTLDTINYVTINYQLDDEISNSFIWNGSLTTNNYEIVTLPTVEVPFGPHTLTVWTELPNGIEDTYTVNDTTILNFTNEPGTTVDLEITFDGLPYGFSWMLVNLDTGELVDDGSQYANSEYSCDSITFTYCLPEGNYELILEDIFGNGLHYYCANLGQSGTVSLINNNDTLAFVWGNWGDEEILPFYIGPPPVECPPLGNCPWDFDNDGIVGVSDILILLQQYGQVDVECSPYDVDEDNVIGVTDILDVMSVFGTLCNTLISTGEEIPEWVKGALRSKGIQIPENQNTVENIEYYNIYGAKINLSEITSSGIYIKKIKYTNGNYQIKKEFFN